MRALLRYLAITGVLVGLAWSCFALPIHGRTVFGHVRSLGDSKVETLLGKIKADLDQRIAHREAQQREARLHEAERRKNALAVVPPSAPVAASPTALSPGPAPAAVPARAAPKARVEKSVHRTETARSPRGSERRTRVDERIPARSEKAVDALLDAHQVR